MYTGIIDHIGHIVAIQDTEHSRHLLIETCFKAIELGESIAIDGICLTATQAGDYQLACELSPETLKMTKAVDYRIGDKVNVERSLSVGDRLGGHTVTGHVDGVARIAVREPQGDCCRMVIAGIKPEQLNLIWHKGSIAVDGISLTINALTADGVELMLIAQTLALTTLSERQVGDKVHVEFDPMAKIIARQFECMQNNLLHREVNHVD